MPDKQASRSASVDGRTRALLRRVAARNDLARLGARWYVFLLALAAAYAALVVVARTLALMPDVFEPETLLVVPAAALVAALVAAFLPGRGTLRREAGRLVDSATGTDDLFLTAALLDRPSPGPGRAGEFRPLVLADAEARAAEVKAAEVVPLRWLPGARDALLALGAALLLTLLLPQLDPFGKHEEREEAARRRARLAETRRETAARAKVLREDPPGPTRAERAAEDLKKAFKAMRPGERQANLKRLSLEQKELGELWRRQGMDKLRDSLGRMPTFQRFGMSEGGKLSEWKRELEKGKTGALGKELGELNELAKKLAASGDKGERERLRRELKRRLRELSEFAATGANSKRLSEAAKRALAQLEMSGEKGLEGEALEGLLESLDLTSLELEGLARAARELQTLEDALEALQLAKGANSAGDGKGLDGSACSGCNSLADYAEFYRNLVRKAGKGRGAGPGMKGPGRGKGNLAPEDEATETDFKTELSKSRTTAGRMLLKWKTRGLSDPGKAREDYRRAVEEVRQGWSEAVIQEQVPPGYHEAIQKYFDTLLKGPEEEGR